MNAQFVYLVDNLVKNYPTRFTVPVFQDFFDRKVGILILREFDNRTTDFLEQAVPQCGRARFCHNLLDDAKTMLVNSKSSQVLVHLFKDKVGLVLLEYAAF